jgi:hypothetical protein
MRITVQEGQHGIPRCRASCRMCFSIRSETLLTDQTGYCTVTADCADRCRTLMGGPTLLPCIIDKAQWRVPGT